MGAAAAVAGIGAAAGIGGSLLQAGSAKSAAGASSQAALQAAMLQKEQYDQTRSDLLPYSQAGQANLPEYANYYNITARDLNNAFNDLQNHIPQAMTQENLIKTPGYQFNLQQGQRAVTNSNAAKGLGVSGSALQGAAKFATGLADSTYQNQFANQQQIYNDYLNQFNARNAQHNTIFGQVQAPVSTGENAAAQSGDIGQKGAAAAGTAITNAGAAQAAGIVGQGNALAGGLNSVGQAGLNYLGIQNALNGGGGFGSSNTVPNWGGRDPTQGLGGLY